MGTRMRGSYQTGEHGEDDQRSAGATQPSPAQTLTKSATRRRAGLLTASTCQSPLCLSLCLNMHVPSRQALAEKAQLTAPTRSTTTQRRHAEYPCTDVHFEVTYGGRGSDADCLDSAPLLTFQEAGLTSRLRAPGRLLPQRAWKADLSPALKRTVATASLSPSLQAQSKEHIYTLLASQINLIKQPLAIMGGESALSPA